MYVYVILDWISYT